MSRTAKRIMRSMSFLVMAGVLAPAASQPASNRLGVPPSAQSQDFVANKQQFQLHSLLTEQLHPRSFDLSTRIAADTADGLASLLAVDEDIAKALQGVADDPARLATLEAASREITRALREGHRLYVYGTGSTGRLAETIESGLWRPFWQRTSQSPLMGRIEARYPALGERVRGEITGGDRALIASLEGFEDIPEIGRLQLQDNGIRPQDLVFAVTEGGETSAVIGTALAAAEQAGADARRTWFVYNNPDEVLRPFERSRRVLDDARITKIPLPTGPQAITGSTRMQATTTSLYVLGVVLEDATRALLSEVLTVEELASLGFNDTGIAERLRGFTALQRTAAAAAPKLAAWTDREAASYANGHRSTYLATRALMPVFVDVTERAPTFRLAPLDPVNAVERRSWIQVWTPAADGAQAWQALLHRPFHGLDKALYLPPFETGIPDPYLREAALRGLSNAGDEQQALYDLSYSPANMQRNAPVAGDSGALILLGDEAHQQANREWLQAATQAGAELVLVSVSARPLDSDVLRDVAALPRPVPVIAVTVPQRDAFELDQTIVLKMLINAHSTGVMAKLGRVVGNTMTSVQPGNLKLIGRATWLILSHVNGVLETPAWRDAQGTTAPLTYAEANAVLFEAIEQRRNAPGAAGLPEVELSVVAVLEALRSGRPVDWTAAADRLRAGGLNAYLAAPPAR
jgi:N-acetylmuramic acid 6-phosphate (MurNAc-6-P) etherase